MTTTKTISLTTYYYKKAEIDNNFVKKSDIQDNLTSTNTDKPLSAKQGKVLKELTNTKISYLSIDEDLNLYIGFDPIVSSSVTASKNIIQQNETTELTATVSTTNNAPLKGVMVDFYILDNT